MVDVAFQVGSLTLGDVNKDKCASSAINWHTIRSPYVAGPITQYATQIDQISYGGNVYSLDTGITWRAQFRPQYEVVMYAPSKITDDIGTMVAKECLASALVNNRLKWRILFSARHFLTCWKNSGRPKFARTKGASQSRPRYIDLGWPKRNDASNKKLLGRRGTGEGSLIWRIVPCRSQFRSPCVRGGGQYGAVLRALQLRHGARHGKRTPKRRRSACHVKEQKNALVWAEIEETFGPFFTQIRKSSSRITVRCFEISI